MENKKNKKDEVQVMQQIAIWVDHREAILAIFTNAHLLHEDELFSGAGPHTHGGGWSQKRLDAHRHAVLDHFYEEIIQHLASADQIVIYGPGQAKYELQKHIEHHKKMSDRVIRLETTEKMSDEHFIRMALRDFISD
jgi:stalled ribosome rescue protein Dom34